MFQKKHVKMSKGEGLKDGYSRRNPKKAVTMTWKLGGRCDGRPPGGGVWARPYMHLTRMHGHAHVVAWVHCIGMTHVQASRYPIRKVTTC
jgi:hypothetical protein